MIWSSGYGLPTVPGLAQPGRRRRRACPRPRSTRSTRRSRGRTTRSSPASPGPGRARRRARRSATTSRRGARASSSSSASRRWNIVGTMWVCVTRCASTSRSVSAAVQRVHQHDRRAVRERADQRDVQRRRVVQRPGAEVDARRLVAREVLDRRAGAGACAPPSVGRSSRTCRASGCRASGPSASSVDSASTAASYALADGERAADGRARRRPRRERGRPAPPPAGRPTSTTSARASQSRTMYAISSTVRCQLIGVSRRPAAPTRGPHLDELRPVPATSATASPA